jgi:CMP/dCMP kinase
MKITIGGLSGTGKTTLGRSVAERLGVPFTSSGDIFRKEADLRGLSLLEMHLLAKENPDIDRAIEDRAGHYGETHDAFVFDGRLAWYKIPDSYKICVICDDSTRLERIRVRDSEKKGKDLDIEAVREETFGREAEMREQYHKLYGITDYMDACHYDLVIDTTGRTLQESTEIIYHTIQGVLKN